MGQAKQRQAEINALKAQLTTVRFFAIRHCEDGQKEFALSEVSFNTKLVNNKAALLREICLKDWLHTPPVGLIAEYLVQTTSYQVMAQMNNADIGYVINFHEVDQEMSALRNEKRYSCRQIMGMTRAKLDTYAAEFAKQLNDTGEYSVKHHA